MAFTEARDLRSIAQDAKRDKSHKAKWALGPRILSDHTSTWNATTETDSPQKLRPKKLPVTHHFPSRNVSKPLRNVGNWDVPQSHYRATNEASAEARDPSNLSRSILEELSSSNQFHGNQPDNFLYSFDRNDTPGKPLSLEVFVKTNPRETEKLVEKEYEVLDLNGDALTGRKARKTLRQKSESMAEEPELIREDDGFELI